MWPGAQGLCNHHYHISSCLRPIGFPQLGASQLHPQRILCRRPGSISTISNSSHNHSHCDAAMVEREKHHYDILRRRISNFVGHSAYEEKLQTDRKKGTADDKDSSGDSNFATNYLKGKKQLAEGSHDRMYKWMGFSSEEEMLQNSGNPTPKDTDDATPTRKKSGVSVTAGVKSGKTSLGPSGGDTKARRRKSSTGTSPRKLSNA